MASFGLTLANRGVIIGAVTVPELFDMARRGEASGVFDAVWVGDSLLAKPRLESITLLSALAAITSKVRLAVGCMATFPHRHPALLAQQWASLDVISNGRAWLAVCLGGPNEQSPAQALEHAVMGIRDTERVSRLEEGIVILRKLLHEENASHEGKHYRFSGVTIQPRPVQKPLPIWIASNPTGLTWKDGASAPPAAVDRGLRRVARYADGWMTNKVTPEEFKSQWTRILAMAREEGRDPAKLGSALYHNINIQQSRDAALAESKAFLDKYYTSNFSMRFVEGFTTAGPPGRCIEELQAYFAAGLDHITLRMTSWDQTGQLRRFLEEVAPALR
ncbi:MAG TPA: LLM class flavin-dependent oxidoreductase [Candidatus Eisenbacteria bacterium]|nr:LLM class flavin-dependent oxidoreductase [Candidatus Eisenbacteria bacterium]